MKLLLVNWQDRENPQAGGAEIHLHEIFGRLAQRGHSVSLLCGGWPGCPSTAKLDGIDVYRLGTRYTFGLLAKTGYRALRKRLGPFDLILEDINKVPVFTPRWDATPVVGIVPHLFGGTAFQELPAPVAAAVWLMERPIPRAYKGIPFQVISESTAADLVHRGIPRASIEVIYCGIDSETYTPDLAAREASPTFAYLGRLKKYKRVDLIVRAFSTIVRDFPESKLLIAGAGDYRQGLERLALSLDLGGRVHFLGRISEEEKRLLLRRAWALLLTSPKEGWGITNLEAAASGTPVIASDSPGIRESVRQGETGFLVPHGDVGAIATAMGRLAGSPQLVNSLGLAGRTFAESFTWERAADQTEAHLENILRG